LPGGQGQWQHPKAKPQGSETTNIQQFQSLKSCAI